MSDTLPLLAQAGSNLTIITFTLYMMAVFLLAWFSNKLLQSKSFVAEYFLGSRSLGVWAFALTFAATSSSGGSFTGFPSKIYTYGWVLALWIASYMVVPVCTMGLLGKRINQVARKSGAITIPDVIRDRFGSPSFGAMAIVLIVFFMSFNLVAQFKAGSLILVTLVENQTIFQELIQVASKVELGTQGPAYNICLLGFGIAVVVYTTYGGFHAVVWTDVLQGVVMVIGVLIMLPLALSLAGGMTAVSKDMAEMTPPHLGEARIELAASAPSNVTVRGGTWFEQDVDGGGKRFFRTDPAAVVLEPGGSADVKILEMVDPTPKEIDGINRAIEEQQALPADVNIHLGELEKYKSGGDEKGVYLTGPGPDDSRSDGFLPLMLAVSFFFMWAISGAGQPSNMVRLMAFNNSRTLKRAVFTVSIYYSAIYFPLVIIFCCARVLLPGMEHDPDRIMPAMAVFLTENWGVAWLGGLLVAAPFAAIMSTVDSFLLMISSALVRDVYQRRLNTKATEYQLKRMSYLVTCVVGAAAMVVAMYPPRFLQDIIVYTGSGLAACFLMPMAAALYWPRVNTAGAAAGMLGGFLTHLSLYVGGYIEYEEFRPLVLFEVNPIIWGLGSSLFVLIIVTLITPPPPAELVRKYFGKES